jgi:serine/threonine protein kinase
VRAAPATPLEPGAVIANRYQIEAVMGQGGSGVVFRAWDRVLGEPIAMKILHGERAAERSWIKRLAREVKVARAIRHPNVCRVFELGNADGHWFITMELAVGGALRQLLRAVEPKPRSLADRLEDAQALCAGLAAIHAVGIIHRDVTPQNVLRMADGRLVLSDFGLAIEVTANTTVHGGTPNYMPPETAMGGRADQRSDVWQLGVILHELIFGRRPDWEHEKDGPMMKWPLSAEAAPVEEELARLCRDCLAANPDARPATAMAVVGRLAAAQAARPRTAIERAWRRVAAFGQRNRKPLFAIMAAVAVLGVARAAQVVSRPPFCRAATDKLAGIWDAPAEASVRQAFERTGRSYAEDTFASVDRILNRYVTAWSEMYGEACEATHVRGEQSNEVLDLRMACLADRLHGVQALSQLLARATGDIVDNAVAAAGALGTLERCADARLLRAVVPPPDDPAARAEVDQIRRGLADAKALHDAGNEPAAIERLHTLVNDARRAGYGPALAESLVLQAQIDSLAGRNDAADAAFKEATVQAEASRYDEVKATAETYLVLTNVRKDRYESADDWARQADATLRRIGGHEQTRAWLEMNVSELRRREGRAEESLAHQQRAIELKERAGVSRADIAHNLNGIAITLNDMGRAREAIGYIERAIVDMGAELGAAHPLVGIFISNKGEILARLGRQADARAAFERALAIEEPAYGKASSNLAYPLTGLGESLLAEHRGAAAIAPLERALEIRRVSESDRTLVADSAFLLARALWESAGTLSDGGDDDDEARARSDRARAVKLAGEAARVYGDQPATRAALDDVERWLASRSTSEPEHSKSARKHARNKTDRALTIAVP